MTWAVSKYVTHLNWTLSLDTPASLPLSQDPEKKEEHLISPAAGARSLTPFEWKLQVGQLNLPPLFLFISSINISTNKKYISELKPRGSVLLCSVLNPMSVDRRPWGGRNYLLWSLIWSELYSYSWFTISLSLVVQVNCEIIS